MFHDFYLVISFFFVDTNFLFETQSYKLSHLIFLFQEYKNIILELSTIERSKEQPVKRKHMCQATINMKGTLNLTFIGNAGKETKVNKV